MRDADVSDDDHVMEYANCARKGLLQSPLEKDVQFGSFDCDVGYAHVGRWAVGQQVQNE